MDQTPAPPKLPRGAKAKSEAVLTKARTKAKKPKAAPEPSEDGAE